MIVGTDNIHHQKRSLRERKEKTRKVNPYILIVCEGEKTEPNYFKSFKILTKDVIEITIDGQGKNTDTLVEEAQKIKKRIEKEKGIKFDSVWCVFDRDSFPPQRFNNAIELAVKKYKFEVAYSNEAFELWYLLHFVYIDSNINRNELTKKLDKIMKKQYGVGYTKNDECMYLKIENRMNTAINNAEKLIELHQNISELNPEKNNPSTTVHKLVKYLKDYIKP